MGRSSRSTRWSALAHEHEAIVVLDANQAVAHQPIDVRKLHCDYLCFSGHKLGGPTGIGVLYGKSPLLERLPMSSIGGGSVEDVHLDGYQPAELPMRLEPGTASFEAAIGLAAACDFLSGLGFDTIARHEHELTTRLVQGLQDVPRVTIRGPGVESERGSIVAFQVEGLEAHGVARMLSTRSNICVRSGFHCAQPAHEYHGWRPTVRASLGVYNTADEIDTLVEMVRQITANLF